MVAFSLFDLRQLIFDNFVVDHIHIEEDLNTHMLIVYVPGVEKLVAENIKMFLRDHVPLGLGIHVVNRRSPHEEENKKSKANMTRPNPEW
jgi:hypothetical protein